VESDDPAEYCGWADPVLAAEPGTRRIAYRARRQGSGLDGQQRDLGLPNRDSGLSNPYCLSGPDREDQVDVRGSTIGPDWKGSCSGTRAAGTSSRSARTAVMSPPRRCDRTRAFLHNPLASDGHRWIVCWNW
jgi:hypothetical protein